MEPSSHSTLSSDLFSMATTRTHYAKADDMPDHVKEVGYDVEPWKTLWKLHWNQLGRDIVHEDTNIDAKLYRRALSGNARAKNNTTNQNQAPNRGNTSSPTAYGPGSMGPPSIPAAPASPSLSTTMTTNEQAHQTNQGSKKVPFFFREEYSGLIVKGNFMTLAAQPHLVEEGEWLAHQGEIELGALLHMSVTLATQCADIRSSRRAESSPEWHAQMHAREGSLHRPCTLQ